MSISGSSISGGGTLLALELLANPTRFQAKIEQLKEAEDAAHKLIDLAGPASEILQIRSDIDADRAAAEKALAHAGENAKTIQRDAELRAAEMVQKAQAQADAIKEEARSRTAGIEKMEKDVTAKVQAAEASQKGLNARMLAAADLERSLEERAKELETLNEQLLQEKSKLATVREQIAAVLR